MWHHRATTTTICCAFSPPLSQRKPDDSTGQSPPDYPVGNPPGEALRDVPRIEVISYVIGVPDTIIIVQRTHEPRDQLGQADYPADHGYLQAYRHTSPM